MWHCIHRQKYRARKKYSDDGWEEIQECWNNFDEFEKMKIQDIKNPHIIDIGDMYERQFNVDSGDTCTWRTKLFFYDLISKYNLFSDD